MCCYFLVPCSGKFGTLSEWSKLLLLATFINVIWWSHICLISLLNPNCFGLAFMHSLDLLWAFCGYFSWGRWDFWFLTWPWLLLLLCLSYVSGFFFFFWSLWSKVNLLGSNSLHRRKKCEMFPANNWWQTPCTKACWKGTCFGGEGRWEWRNFLLHPCVVEL